MTKIVHMTSVHHRYDTRIFYKQCVSLSSAGNKVFLIVADGEGHAHEKGIEIIDARGSIKGRFGRMLSTTRRVYNKAIELDADIYHFHDPELLPWGWLLKKKGKRVVYDIHEDVPRQILSKHWIPQLLRRPVSHISEVIEEFFAKRLDGLVCVVPVQVERFKKINPNTVMVCNYPILEELHISNSNWPSKERAVCYVGGISGIRGLFEMVEAAEYLDGVLYMAGPISNLQEWEQAKTMPGWRNVRYVGILDRQGIKALLERSMAGLVLLRPTGNYLISYPIKMFEYMSASIPVIASDFPLWREIVEGNKCGIRVNPKDTREVANAINWILDNPEEAQKMGENGRRAIEEKYSWERESQKLGRFYEGQYK